MSATLFKFILKKYLVEKYNYSRPEYLKDFYVASDLVCKRYKLDIYNPVYTRVKEKHSYPPGRNLRDREKYIGIPSWKQIRHLNCHLHRYD